MKILYFARYRQIIGRGQDDVNIPADITTVAGLIDFLRQGDERIAEAFGDMRTLKVAVNQKHANFQASLTGAREVAFFPPVTGG
jgi:sulfur-carrier protein